MFFSRRRSAAPLLSTVSVFLNAAPGCGCGIGVGAGREGEASASEERWEQRNMAQSCWGPRQVGCLTCRLPPPLQQQHRA